MNLSETLALMCELRENRFSGFLMATTWRRASLRHLAGTMQPCMQARALNLWGTRIEELAVPVLGTNHLQYFASCSLGRQTG